jgi:hypothetical protein
MELSMTETNIPRVALVTRFLWRDDVAHTLDATLEGDERALIWLQACRELFPRIEGPAAGRPICGCCDRTLTPQRKPEIIATIEPMFAPPEADLLLVTVGICNQCVRDANGDMEKIHRRLGEHMRAISPSYRTVGRLSEAGSA